MAVGSGFPTFLSMKLRSIYHTGDDSVPPVFMIENHDDDAQWSNQFNQINGYLVTKSLLKVITEAKLLPWESPIKTIYEDSYHIPH